MIGRTISHYRILKQLGGGGMGVVYEAEDLSLMRHVALKFLPESNTHTEEALERFRREAQSASLLNHPNICTIYEIGEHEGHPYIAMELMKGRTLKSVIAGQPLETVSVVDFGLQIADALDAAHAENIIHRDIKPLNIFITERGQVKLLDFGLAKRTVPVAGSGDMPTASIESELTKTGSMMGTIAYMSPEQARGKDLDARSDLYSFGVVLYEMATGSTPFGNGTAGEILEALFTRDPDPPSQIHPRIPARLEEIILKAMEKDPNLRYQSAAEIRTDLHRLKRGTSQVSMRSQEYMGLSPRGRARFRLGIALAAAIAALLAGGLFYFGRAVKTPELKPARGVVQKTTIAVLPFADLSSNKDQEYFSDGLTEELLNELAKNPNLQVISRTSSFSFKNRTDDIKTIARKLNVTHVLEGSVRKSENQLRITAQLIETATDSQLWSQTYDREMSNIFAIQNDIATSVAGALRVALHPGSTRNHHQTNEEAYIAYLEGSYFHEQYGKEDLEKAVEKFKRAIEIDPKYARAWIGLAWVHSAQADVGYIPLEEGYALARAEVNRGLELDPNLASGYAALGWIKSSYDWDWTGADAAFQKALKLEPGQASVYGNAATQSAVLGRFEEALELGRTAIRLDPLSTTIYHNHGHHAYRAGKLEDAEVAFLKTLELNPQYLGTRTFLGRVYLVQSKFQEALAIAEREPSPFWRTYGMALASHALGKKQEADALLTQLVNERQDDAAFQIAEIYAYRGEIDTAFRWLERAYQQRDGGLLEIKKDPLLRGLTNDPRWKEFLKKMKLPLD